MFIENELANVQCGVFVLQKNHTVIHTHFHIISSLKHLISIFFCFWQMKSLPDFH